MLLLAGMPEVAGAIGERAAAHILERHGLEQAGAEYWQLLEEADR
jgi:hypothetical protein